MAKPTTKQLASLASDLVRFFTNRPDDLTRPYAMRVSGFISGIVGDPAPVHVLGKNYDRGFRIGEWLKAQVDGEAE